MSDETAQPTGPQPPEAKFGYTHNGVPIVKMKAILNKTGDGLSDALDVQPIQHGPLEEAFMGTRMVHTEDRLKYARENGYAIATLIQVFRAEEAAFIEGGSIEVQLADTASKIAARKETEGQLAFTTNDPGDGDDEGEGEGEEAAHASNGTGTDEASRQALEEVLST